MCRKLKPIIFIVLLICGFVIFSIKANALYKRYEYTEHIDTLFHTTDVLTVSQNGQLKFEFEFPYVSRKTLDAISVELAAQHIEYDMRRHDLLAPIVATGIDNAQREIDTILYALQANQASQVIEAQQISVDEQPTQTTTLPPAYSIGTVAAGYRHFQSIKNWNNEQVQQIIDSGAILNYGGCDINANTTKYFAGHNPGAMSYLSWITVGSIVTVADGNSYRDYEIICHMPTNETRWSEITIGDYRVDMLMHNQYNLNCIFVQFCINGINNLFIGLPT